MSHVIGDSSRSWWIDADLNGEQVRCKMDTEAEANVLRMCIYSSLHDRLVGWSLTSFFSTNTAIRDDLYMINDH